MNRFALVVALLTFAAPTFAADKYAMKDLEALAASESWGELLSHGLDIAPSERNAQWQAVIEKAAIGRLEDMKEEDLKSLSRTKGLVESDQKSFTFLKKSTVYRRAANKTIVKTLKGCYMSRECKNGNDPDWLAEVRSFVKEQAADPQTGCEAGEMVASFMVAYVALPSFEFAVTKADAPCCKSDALKKAVDAGHKEEGSYGEMAKKIGGLCKLPK